MSWPGYTEVMDAEARRARPIVVTLCGSTRFGAAFREWNLRFTLRGYIVLSIGCDTRSDDALWDNEADRTAIKVRLDELHKRKIDLSDMVFILDVDGYIGASTRSEIEYATAHNKRVLYLSFADPGYRMPPDPLAAALQERIAALETALRRVRHTCTTFRKVRGNRNGDNEWYCRECRETAPGHLSIVHRADCPFALLGKKEEQPDA